MAEHNDDSRPALRSIFIHSVEGIGRVVGTDGKRMFVGSFRPSDAPSWLGEGIKLSVIGLRPKLSMMAKGREAPEVRISWAKGLPRATLSDRTESMMFAVEAPRFDYVDYSAAIPAQSFGTLDPDGQPVGHEWDPVGINSVHLKHVGDLAKTLEAGLPKERRSKSGMIVRCFNGGGSRDTQPLIFDFSGWPGALMLVITAKLANPALSTETARLLAPQVKLTIAALRAHATRWLQRVEISDDPAEKAYAAGKAEEFQARVAEILKRVPGLPALTAQEDDAVEPEAQAAAEAQAEAEDEHDAAAE